MSPQLLLFNGVDGSTGEFLLPPMTPRQIAAIACGETWDVEHVKELKWRLHWLQEATFGPKEGVDPKDLAMTGWGVIFAHDADPAIRDALSELLDHRREQASRSMRSIIGSMSVRWATGPERRNKNFWRDMELGPGPSIRTKCHTIC
jgi:hypothetical protein